MVCVVVVAGACAPDPDVEVAYSLEVDSCPANTCGNGNSPVVDGVYFWRLHLGGQANPEGVQITSVHHGNGVPMQLTLVEGDRLRGLISLMFVEHAALIGTKIGVSVLVKGQPQPYEILISGVAPSVPIAQANERFWVGGSDSQPPLPIEAYDFSYRPLWGPDQDVRRPLCSEGDGDPTKLRALVFGGDLYNPVTKEIEVGPAATDGWMNIACVHSATYKMHKIGHTSAAQAKPGIKPTTVAQRRAMLNAWTSNVCGTGKAFTHQGEPIKLRESLDLLPDTSSYLDPLDTLKTESIEAIWGETGAVCLDVHRLDTKDSELVIPCRAALQSCDALLVDWKAHGHVLTGNPFPNP